VGFQTAAGCVFPIYIFVFLCFVPFFSSCFFLLVFLYFAKDGVVLGDGTELAQGLDRPLAAPEQQVVRVELPL
jgi:hypothetical protein